MHTPTGRGPQAPDMGAKLKALQRSIEHVDRKLSGIKPAAAGGGGPIAVAQVFSTDGTVGPVASSTTALDYNAVRYGAPVDPFGFGGNLGWLGFDSAEPSIITLAPGWYTAIVEFNVTWATASDSPDNFNPIIYFGGAGHDWDKKWVAATTDSAGRRGIHDFLSIGEIYASDSFTVLQAQLNYTAAASSGPYYYPRIVWKICKWS